MPRLAALAASKCESFRARQFSIVPWLCARDGRLRGDAGWSTCVPGGGVQV